MLVNEDIETPLKQNQGLAELFVEPLNSNLSDLVLSLKFLDKIHLSRITTDLTDVTIVKALTPLFRYIVDDSDSAQGSMELSTMSISSAFHDDNNSNISQEGQNYVAIVDGLFVIAQDSPRIIPVNYDGSAEVRVSKNSMEVLLDIYPSFFENPIPTVEEIENKIRNLGVVVEINKDLISRKLLEVKSEKIKIINICVAQGKFPENGIDGQLENCTNKKEKIKNLDFDEFHKVNPVISVKEKDQIAILHPPTEGEHGNDIFGKTLEPKSGKPCRIRLGTNTYYSEADETNIIAKTDGFLNISETEISITDTFTVRGDIDFSSGNIVGKGSLTVNGNVNNDFSLCLSKDINIGGYVGDAKLDAGENIVIKGGFLGQGNGVINAEGNVDIKFVENQTVYSRGILSLTKDALNANLYIRKDIMSKGTKTAIIGGHTIAGDNIEVNSVGNDTRTETIIEVGFDYLKRNSIDENKDNMADLIRKLEEVDKNIFEFAKMKRLNEQSTAKLKLLAKAHKDIEAEIDKIKQQNMKITNEIYIPTTSKITVKGTIFPGVRIGINGRFLNIDNPMSSKTFILSEDNEVIAT